MIKARKRFVIYAMAAIFVLLVVLLGIINLVSFTMASEDADSITQMLAQQQGAFANQRQQGEWPDVSLNGMPPNGMIPNEADPNGINPGEGSPAFPNPLPNANPMNPGPFGLPMDIGLLGLDSPEMPASLRYFTYAYDKKEDTWELVAWQISAVTEEEALTWAQSLMKEQKTGWTATSYRYRVYRDEGKTYITVIDQSRELTGPYRLLTISAIGLVLGMIVSAVVLTFIGRRLFRPLEEADRKQKRFIADAEKEFKIPLTIINANTEIIERENGETEHTLSINRQVKRMNGLIKTLSTVGVFEEKDLTRLQFDLSALALAASDAVKGVFAERNCELRVTAPQPLMMTGDSEAMSDLLVELLENGRKFALTWAELKVEQENGRVSVIASNDTNLPAGTVDQVFDRFTRLDNARNVPGVGLGLSHVKEIVQAHNGRVHARVADGVFTLRVNL